MRLRIACFLLGLFLSGPARGATDRVRMASTPALTPDGRTLVFEWQEDLWTVPSTGGVAAALTRQPGLDRFPVVSPEGSRVAFLSEREGFPQVYVMPLAGGRPEAATFHSDGAVPQDWYPDGQALLVRGARDQARVLPHRFLTVSTAGRVAEKLLFDERGDWGRLSPDGTKLLFMRDGEDLYRRGYRGSKAASVWLYDVSAGSFSNVARGADGRECRWPLWRPDGKGFYFVREAGEPFGNLFEKDLGAGAEVQRTFFTNAAVIMPAISRDGSTLVFRAGFDFYRWNPAGDREPARIEIVASPDSGPARTRRVKYDRATNEDFGGSVNFASDNKQVVFAAGGDLWVMDTVVRDPVQLTSGSGLHDNWAFFTEDLSAILFLRDSGRQVDICRATRKEPEKPWWQNRSFAVDTVLGDGHARSMLRPSPGDRRIAWVEPPGSLWVCDAGGANPRKLLTSPCPLDVDWSPDSAWLAVSVQDSDDNRDVWIVSADGRQPPYNLSRHPNWDGGPAWSPDGRVVAYTGRTYDNDIDIYYAWLRIEDHGKLLRETEAEQAGREDEKKKDDKESPAASNAPPAEVRIDFEGLADRVQRVRLPGTSPSHLFWSWDGKALGFRGTVDGKAGTWKIFFPYPDKPASLSSRLGEWVDWRKDFFCWAIDGVPARLDDTFPFAVRFERDLADWRRLGFRQMWRALRDEFYDPRLNNLDWNAVLERYESVLDDVDDAGFARLVGMMIGDLDASHLDFKPAERPNGRGGAWKFETGHLGLRFEDGFAGPGLRVKSVIRGAPADREVTRLKPGDVILALNGEAVGPGYDLTRVLNGPLPRDVRVRFERDGAARELSLPLSGMEAIRDLVREEEAAVARARVAEWSGGRIGYINIAAMKNEDLRQFEKQVYEEGYGREGLVLDVRYNDGGFTADQVLSILCHPRHAVTVPRDGETSYQGSYLSRPFWTKPVIAICNAYTASNGEIFSHAIRNTGRGKLVGQTTQGGVISTSERRILDLGTFRIPHRGWFALPSGEDMELQGAVPDIAVDNPPGAHAAGQDPQLKAAVDALLKDLESLPPPPKIRYASESRD
jgi:tricorn protease